MADTTQWPLPLDRVQAIVDHLVNDGSRKGIILGDELNVAMGASARRRAARMQAEPPVPKTPEEKRAFSRDWDERYAAGQKKKEAQS